MAKLKSQGFNKEQLVFLLASVLLAVSFYRLLAPSHWPLASRPVSLEPNRPVTRMGGPQKYEVVKFEDKRSVDAFLAGDRKSPFSPKDYIAERNPDTGTKNTSKNPPPAGGGGGGGAAPPRCLTCAPT
ncbi:MAG: hypothetical protein AMXMBFR7_52850 [Planctomycetota bacterium]